MKRVLLLPSSDYLGHPFPQRYNQIFERLHDNKTFEVHVFNFNLFGKKRSKSKTILHNIDGFNINNTAHYYLINVFKQTSELRKIIINESIDIIVFSNLFVPLMYNIFNTIQDQHIPIVFDAPDYYPTSASGYIAKLNSVLGKVITGTFEIMFQYLLKKSSIVSVASHALKGYAEKIGVNNVVHIPNGISKDFFRLQKGNKLRETFGVHDSEILVGYIGSIEFWLDIEPLFKGIEMALEKDIPIKLLLVGKGLHTNFSKFVNKLLKKYNLEENTCWHNNFIEYSMVPSYMASLDLGTIPFNITNPTAYYSAPNKMWEYASQMTPILSSSIPEARYYSDYLTITNNAQQYFKAIKRYNQNDSFYRPKQISARKKALQMTWENSTNIMAETLMEL